MSEPIREQALSALVTTLQTIRGIRPWGDSYPNTPVVERRYKTATQFSEYPALLVLEGPSSTFDIVAVDGMFEHKVAVVIYGYVQGDDRITRSTWLQRLWDDLITTLQANRLLGGVSSDIEIGSLETDEGELEPLGAFAQSISVTLFESKTVQ